MLMEIQVVNLTQGYEMAKKRQMLEGGCMTKLQLIPISVQPKSEIYQLLLTS